MSVKVLVICDNCTRSLAYETGLCCETVEIAVDKAKKRGYIVVTNDDGTYRVYCKHCAERRVCLPLQRDLKPDGQLECKIESEGAER